MVAAVRAREAMRRFSMAIALMLLLGCVAGRIARADAACVDLRTFKLVGGEVTGAAMDRDEHAGAYCRVSVRLTPTPASSIRSEIWLPSARRWNGKFEGVGNGGLAGDIPHDTLAEGLRRGYATAATDTGHDNVAGVGRFALGAPEKIADYGHRAIHVTALAGQAITAAYYRKKPRHRYFVGCSQGGQEALMEAQRYPADYDGIIAGDPDYNQTHHEVGAHLWVVDTLYGAGGATLGQREAKLIGAAVNRACDALDGVTDGVLEDPRRCDFDAGALQCRGADANDCLGAAQVQAVRRLWAGPDATIDAGYYPGLERGGEADLWGGWIVAPTAEENTHGSLGLPFFRYFVYGEAAWDFRSFDFHAEPARIDAMFGAALDATDADLRPFQRARRQADPLSWLQRSRYSAAREHRVPRPRLGARRTWRWRFLPALHGAGHGALRRWSRAQPLRHARGARALGRAGHRAAAHRRPQVPG